MKKKEKKIKKQKSIKRQIIIVLSLIMALTVAACFLLNSFFLEKFYTKSKINALKSVYYTMEKAASEDSVDSSEYDDYLRNISATHNVSIAIITSLFSPVKIYSVESREVLMREIRNNVFGTIYPHKIYEAENDYVLIEIKDATLMSDYLEMLGKLPDGSFFLLRTPMEAIRISAGVASKFVYFTAGLMLVICTLAIIVLSKLFKLKSKNDELLKENELRAQVDDMRKEFISNVSHELKTPIALIQGYAEGLKEGIADDSEKDYYCDVIGDEASKMNTMVKKLLTLNQLESGKDFLSKEWFDIKDLINNYLDSLSILFKQNDISVSTKGVFSCEVFADEFKIEEVFENYITNAVNHCASDTKKRIDVTLQKSENIVKVIVFNTGEKIPEDSISHLFEKFYKVDKARSREYGGSGVGLSIVKAIMEAHNREYGVYNGEEGVFFFFTLECK